MQTANYQPTQPVTSPLTNNQSMEARKSFFFTHRQLTLISLLGGLVLLLIFGLGIRAGEKRALRKQIMPQTQSAPTPILPSPTTVPPPTSTSTPVSPSVPSTESRTGEKEILSSGTACERDVDCLSCFAVPGTPIVNCDAGKCVNGTCVWKEGKAPPSKRHE